MKNVLVLTTVFLEISNQNRCSLLKFSEVLKIKTCRSQQTLKILNAQFLAIRGVDSAVNGPDEVPLGSYLPRAAAGRGQRARRADGRRGGARRRRLRARRLRRREGAEGARG